MDTQKHALFAILQKYDFSSKSQRTNHPQPLFIVVCDTAKVRFFKQITTIMVSIRLPLKLFAILQKYDFSSKSQLYAQGIPRKRCCLRYCKSTIFQANHNPLLSPHRQMKVVCDTAKVRFFKQITTIFLGGSIECMLFAILQKYDFSSKSQQC